ncbi:MAG: leucine-rich repeat protein, partial [Ruminococcus sp.]
TNPRLYNASLELGDVRIVSKLVRNTADVSGIEPSIKNTYNVLKMAYDRGELSAALEQMPEDPELRAALYEALQEALSKETTVTVGYVNNTNMPIVLQQVRTTSSKSEEILYGGENGETPIVEAGSTHNSDCTIKLFEPYYTISYDDLLEGEEEGLPDRYYIQREKQELVLPNLVRPGYHFDKWNGGMYFADQEKVGDTTVLSFDWNNNLVNASYNFGDETLFPTFKRGYTITFNPRGGTIDGEESAIYELNTKSESFFDIGDYVPEREGHTFLGWCYKPAALYNSLIEDTSNYDWMNNTSGYDIQLYAKWAEESDEELETNGFRLDEETGELTIITDNGVKGWNSLCRSTNNECKAKVKSAFVGGDLTTVPKYIFSGCENLKSVVLPETVKDIYDYAFENCSSLEAIEMPGVTRIFEGAFNACTSLKTIEMPLVKTIYSRVFEECTSLKTIIMPSVTSIGSYAFLGCSSLEAVTITPQTEYIGDQAFYKCSQLREVVFERTEYDENKDRFSVSDNAFEECKPELVIYVQPSMLNLFKDTFMPAYADIITDEVPVREITEVVINNAPASCTVGEEPTPAATKGDSGAYTFYEYWEEWAQTENGLEPVKFWYSDAEQMNRVPADQRITAFEEGKTYSYSIIAEANENYAFASIDVLSVMLNGEDFTAKSEVIMDGKSLMIGPGKFMKPVTVEQKEIEVVEINNATVSFKAGDKPVFTGTVPDGAMYVLDYEGWFGGGEFISGSDYWNSAFIERGWCDGLISSFKANTVYEYGIYIKLTEEGYNAGYRFGKNTALSVNGEAIDINPDDVNILDDGTAAIFSRILTITPDEKQGFLIGDTNMNGKITISDATLIQKICAGIVTPENETMSKLADVNGDGQTTVSDATLIQKYLVGGFSNTGNAGKYLNET